MAFDEGDHAEDNDEENPNEKVLEPPPVDQFRIQEYTGLSRTPIMSLIDYKYMKPSHDSGAQKPIRECFKPNFGVSYAE